MSSIAGIGFFDASNVSLVGQVLQMLQDQDWNLI